MVSHDVPVSAVLHLLFSLGHLNGFSEKVNGIVKTKCVYMHIYPCFLGMANEIFSFLHLKACCTSAELNFSFLTLKWK